MSGKLIVGVTTAYLSQVQISTKHDQITTHLKDKSGMVSELTSVLRQLCELQNFHGRNLEKLAVSLSKLIHGKDPLKGLVIMMEQLLATLAQQATKMAQQIKDDVLPFIEASQKPTTSLTSLGPLKQASVNLDRRLRAFRSSQLSYQRAAGFFTTLDQSRNLGQGSQQKIVNSPLRPKQSPDRQRQLDTLQEREAALRENIVLYNAAIDRYSESYQRICFQVAEEENKYFATFRDTLTKLFVLQIDCIKNIEYSVVRFSSELKTYGEKVTIPTLDKLPLVASPPPPKIHLESTLLNSKPEPTYRRILKTLQSSHPPGALTIEIYRQLCSTLYPLLDTILLKLDFRTLKDLISFCQGLFVPLKWGQQLSLLNGILSHPLFSSVNFWSFQKGKLQNLRDQSANQQFQPLKNNLGGQQHIQSEFDNQIKSLLCLKSSYIVSETLQELKIKPVEIIKETVPRQTMLLAEIARQLQELSPN